MNTKTLKGIGVAISLLVGIGAASPVLAKATSARKLGAATNAIDVWTFTCPADFPIGQARVYDLAATANAPAQMQVVSGKKGHPSVQVTDTDPPSDGEGGGPSVMATLDGGEGIYVVAFKKTAPGVEGYIGEMFCRDENRAIHNPTIDLQIDQ
ncbi:MAG: hypothetical protein H0U97_18935 [Gammaproteobacteria bacterium]|nr:hypothetical protein [Gammaproteobacteria bacterium]